ncbi:MAG: NUDIX hydrolase [Tepidimonas sp.]|nr:NUDIX hydrolase [Tepidimonas sp.]
MRFDPQPDHLVETPLRHETLWQGSFLALHRDEVRLPDGGQARRVYLTHPGAVMVVPLLDDGRLVVERQYRYPLRQAFVEFPAGKLDPDEGGWACAVRELREETGYQATEWARAGVLHPCIGYANEVIEIWFARGLRHGARTLDEGEFLDVLALQPQELLEAAARGELTDGKTLVGLLWWQNVTDGRWTLQWRSAEVWAQDGGCGR